MNIPLLGICLIRVDTLNLKRVCKQRNLSKVTLLFFLSRINIGKTKKIYSKRTMYKSKIHLVNCFLGLTLQEKIFRAVRVLYRSKLQKLHFSPDQNKLD